MLERFLLRATTVHGAVRCLAMQGRSRTASARRGQRGVVLIIALVLLLVIALLTLNSMRNASSSENIAGNARTTELATQAADLALRHCEASLLFLMGGVTPYATTFVAANVLPATQPPKWQDMSTQSGWDSNTAPVFVLPLALVNQPGMTFDTYRRSPECMVETVSADTTANSVFYVVTARGFGPEVPALIGGVRIRPEGSEIWVQSNIELVAKGTD